MKNKSIKSKLISHCVIGVVFFVVLIVTSYYALYDMGLNASPAAGAVMRWYVIFLLVFCICFAIAIILIIRSMIGISEPIRKVTRQASLISQGKPVVRYEHPEKNEIGELSASVNSLLDYLIGRVMILRQINDGDYTLQVEPIGESDNLSKVIVSILNTNNEVLLEIKGASDRLSAVAREMSNGAMMLASGSSEQAASIEQFSAVMTEVQSMAEQNAEIAQSTLKGVQGSRVIMERSVTEITHMTEAMKVITESARRIEKVIKVIDDIAFQTNILALNATVEAARAGQHGKGFAVVADEVRELASKSAIAARETAALIQMSIRHVDEGNVIVGQTSRSIKEIGQYAADAGENMYRLVESSENQRRSIAEINRGISQISDVVQANSAMAEQSSAMSDEMSAQSEHLKGLVARFKLRGIR